MSPFVAIDWGTTNVRGWRVDQDGEVQAALEWPFGVGRLGDVTAAQHFARTVRPALGGQDLPALLCGMIGSNLGWRETPYVACPADTLHLLDNLATVETSPALVRIVPGLVCQGPTGMPDVMRGEETQVFGWLSRKPSRRAGSHLVCHPGTHSKWVRVVDGSITQFSTAITGELFDVLRRASVIGKGSVADDASEVDAGLAAAGDGSALSARLFATRARVVARQADAEHAPSFLSGLLVGSEVAAMPALMNTRKDETIHVIGSPHLAELYGLALKRAGWRIDIESGEDAVLAGMKHMVELGAFRDV